jgi:hypothetical protein
VSHFVDEIADAVCAFHGEAEELLFEVIDEEEEGGGLARDGFG